MSDRTLYDTDFVLWLETTATLLRERKLEELDYDNLIEEIESMAQTQRIDLDMNLIILLAHWLKWEYQPRKRSGSWAFTIAERNLQITDSIQDSPSLKKYFEEVFDECYANAVLLVNKETGLSVDSFPDRCPFSIEQILDINALPRWQEDGNE